MTEFERRASSSVEAFLLDEDDPRVVRAREEMSRSGRGQTGRRTESDWTACHARHLKYRALEEVGRKRPLMKWEDGGSCKPPEYMWREWALGQVERVWDTIDIAWLRNLKRGFDHQYKV